MYKAVLNNLACSPRKVGLVLGLVRGLPVGRAISLLRFCRKAVSPSIAKLIYSAASQSSEGMDTLIIKEAYVGKSIRLKRASPRARGRSNRIIKQRSMVTVLVEDTKIEKELGDGTKN